MVRGPEKKVKNMKNREQFRIARQEQYSRLFTGRDLFIAGLCIMPALLFNPGTWGRTLQFLLFWVLSVLAGKKNKPLTAVLVILGITVFNLLVPYGQVLFSLGAFNITRGALLSGLRRGVTLEGLFMLSRLTVRQDLHLPGGFGELAGEAFRILALITEKKYRIRADNLIAGIDGLMLELSAPEAPAEAAPPVGEQRNHSPLLGILILGAAVIAAWLPWLFFRDDAFFPFFP
jgi:heptaprenyl diphosphate synthase